MDGEKTESGEKDVSEELEAILSSGEEHKFEKELVEEEEAVPEEKKKSIYQQVLTMTISQKVQLAMKGNKEARGLLIKEPNKLICTAVLKSPKLTEPEVVAYAKSRSVGNEVFSFIASKKEWMRNREIVTSLIFNPRTPAGISIKLMNILNDKEMAELAKSKTVSGALVAAAKRVVAAKQQKGQKKGGH